MAVFTVSAWSASSVNSAGYEAYRAGDGVYSVSANFRWAAASTGAAWLKADMGSGKTATYYVVGPGGFASNQDPSGWTFEGSNDDSSWTTLDTRGSVTFSGNALRYAIASPASYRYYRLNITGTSGGVASVSELQIGDDNAHRTFEGATPEQVSDATNYNLGVVWSPVTDGTVTALRYYECSAANGTTTLRLYGASGTVLASGTHTASTGASGWREVSITPVAVTAGAQYMAASELPGGAFGRFANGGGAFTGETYYGLINVKSSTSATYNSVTGNGRFNFGGSTLPTNVSTNSAYAVGVVFEVSSSSAVSVSAPAMAVVESVKVPTVTAGASVSVAGPALALVAALLSPAVSAGTGVRVDAPTVSASTAVLAPAVTMGGAVTVAAPALGVTVTVPAPAVSAGGPVLVDAPALGLSTAVPAPAISIDDVGAVRVSAPVLALVTAMPEPGVTGVLPAERVVTSLTHTPVGIISSIPLLPVTPLAQSVPIMRLSVLAPDLSAEYPAHPAPGEDGAPEVVEEVVGYPQLWIGGQNVANFRDAPTVIRRWESEAPFGDTVAAFEFPQLNPWDKPGTGDLAFLRKDASVQIGMREESSTFPGTFRVRRLWSGFLDARGNGLGEGEDYAWEAKGTFWQAQSQIREPEALTSPVDIGVQIARTMNAVEGRRWAKMPLTPIGITTMTRGSRDETFWDYVQTLLTEAITDDLRQWTLTEIAVNIPRLVLKPAPSTIHATVAYGTPGVDIDLRVDESTRVDRVFMRGIGPKMGGWANVYYPGIELLAAPAYPNNDLRNIDTGDTDADTDSGTGVTDWQRRVNELKGFANPAVSGVMSSAWAAVVDDVQRMAHVTVDGSLGPQTWNATFDRAIRGVDMRPVRLPLASKVAANKYLYSAAGVKLGANPSFDKTLVVRDVAIDIGPGKTKAQGRKLARKILSIYGNAAANGQIVWTTDPVETDRTRLSHLSNVKVTGFEGEDRVVQVASKSVELDTGADGPAYVVTTRVDERARDAMAVEDLLEQRRSAQPDPSRRPGNPSKASRQVADQRTPWDSESPCGVLRRTAVNGSSGLWSVVTVPFAEVGKLAGIRLTSTRPFALALFASLRITENKLASIVGNPFGSSDPWRDVKGQLDAYGIIEAWGEQDNACGYSPKTETDGGSFTGEFILDTPVDYWTETVPYVAVAIYMRGGSGWIEGEFIPAYEP